MPPRPPFSPPEILLLGPGPSPVSQRVLAAQSAPLLGHLDPDFVQLMDRVQDDLRSLFGTMNRFTLPISGTGSAGMETCFVNLVEPGDRVVVGIHGIFGERMKELALRQGGDVVEVRAAYGRSLDVSAMVQAIRAGPTKLVAVVHAETSTGVLQPPREILAAARAHGALTLLDCVTSLGGAPVAIDDWGVDAAYSGTQKCLSVPPGLAPVTFSDRAMRKAKDRKQKAPSWYLDVNLLGAYWGGDRVYHHTAPVSMVYGLAAGLDEVFEEGLEARRARHAQVAQCLYRGLEVLGLTCLVAKEERTPMVTSVHVPEGVDELTVRKHLLAVHRIEIGGGLGSLKGKIWRIGLLGHGARLASVLRVLSGFGDALASLGRKVDVAAALRAANG